MERIDIDLASVQGLGGFVNYLPLRRPTRKPAQLQVFFHTTSQKFHDGLICELVLRLSFC